LGSRDIGNRLVVPSNLDFGDMVRDHRQGRGGRGMAKAYQGLGVQRNNSRRGQLLKLERGQPGTKNIHSQVFETPGVAWWEESQMRGTAAKGWGGTRA